MFAPPPACSACSSAAQLRHPQPRPRTAAPRRARPGDRPQPGRPEHRRSDRSRQLARQPALRTDRHPRRRRHPHPVPFRGERAARCHQRCPTALTSRGPDGVPSTTAGAPSSSSSLAENAHTHHHGRRFDGAAAKPIPRCQQGLRLNGCPVVVALAGAFRHERCWQFQSCIDELIDSCNGAALIVVLRDVTFIDSCGISALLQRVG